MVDMSPSIVNQTALLDLPKAFLVTLSTILNVKAQYFGLAIDVDDALVQRNMLMGQLGTMLGNPRNYKSEGLAGRSDPVLFLDPLYVMFGGVQAYDSVLVLDVSPVTNPTWHRADVAAAYKEAYRRIVESGAACYFISDNTRLTFNAAFSTAFGRETTIHLFLPEKRISPVLAERARYPYFLFVGSLERRKNIVGGVKAFLASGLAREGYKLVIVGGNGHGCEDIPENYFADPSIVFTGYLSDARINELYAGAAGFLYLSYLEGFGVPIVEAMYHGLPIIASNTSAIPEVLGGLGYLVNPDDHISAAARLRDVVALTLEERKSLSESMRERVQSCFSREKFDKTVLNLFGQRYAR